MRPVGHIPDNRLDGLLLSVVSGDEVIDAETSEDLVVIVVTRPASIAKMTVFSDPLAPEVARTGPGALLIGNPVSESHATSQETGVPAH